jgi:hypothetical protein
MGLFLFKRNHNMHWSLKQEVRRGTLILIGTEGQKGDMFGESTGKVDNNVPSDAFLGGNRKCTEQIQMVFQIISTVC